MTQASLVERLTLCGTAPDSEISALAKEAGLARLVAVLVDEVLFRCDAPVNTTPVHVALEVLHGGEEHRTVLWMAAGEPVRVVDGDVDPPTIRRHLRISLTDLVRRLYGPLRPQHSGDFTDVFLPNRPADLSELRGILEATHQAGGTLLSGCTAEGPGLGPLSVKYGSDKWASFHWYTQHYEKHFAAYRDRPVRVLEIGIGGYEGDLGGPSLKMWKRYFHRGLVYGLDLFDKSALNQDRLTALTGDQGNAETLREVAEKYGPFDIIIDDGSHENEHVRVSFDALFPYVRPGGLYVIEDLQTAYWPRFGGTSGPVTGPDTSVGLLKRLQDDLHYREFDPKPGEPTLTQSEVIGVHTYHNIAFIEKGVNGETSIPAWMDDEAWKALGAITPEEGRAKGDAR
ncbi:class I SAM-dependent methyltransferase [Streptomyces huiliensis]|uniref:class I SAM-dependent methyltransferase n=1 Tax=Streptomyces huiliensis TaxID=2876027 RepID=UPI001CBF67CD|nr:class I SAM-dependent methyltransferase [Streptomyces huiliensis]MBZ4319381.1 hypothetical protein [Streptomyces huiliensis]